MLQAIIKRSSTTTSSSARGTVNRADFCKKNNRRSVLFCTFPKFLWVRKNTQGDLKKFCAMHASPQKCPKIHIFSVSSRFLAFLECLDSKKKYSQLPQHLLCHHKKFHPFSSKNEKPTSILVRGSHLTPNLHWVLKAPK